MAKYLEENGLASVWSKIKSLVNSHINNRNNPHQLTKSQIGLNNVDNTSDMSKPVSTATELALSKKVDYIYHKGGVSYDANTLVQVGYHEFGANCTLVNFPADPLLSSNAFDMFISTTLGNTCQTIIYQDQYTYVRSKSNALEWGAWVQYSTITNSERSTWNAKASTAVATSTANGLMAKEDKTKLNGIAAGAEVNQNAFSHVLVGGTTLSADQKVDVLTLAAGSNITLTPDAATDKVTISTTANNYVHPATPGNKHIPSGGKSRDYLKWSADGTAEWGHFRSSMGDSESDDIPPTTSAVKAYGTVLEGTMNTKVNGLRDEISNAYAKKSDIAGMYKYKGSVADATKLPTTGQVTGDVYNIVAASVYGGPGANVAWDGTRWDSLGEIFQITSMTASDIDAICV